MVTRQMFSKYVKSVLNVNNNKTISETATASYSEKEVLKCTYSNLKGAI